MRYRRAQAPGGTFFFTVALADRSRDLLVANIDLLRAATRRVRLRHSFEIVAMVVLPDHLHAVWRLPEGDGDYAKRWSLIKAGFSRALPNEEQISASRLSKRERAVWQRRYWEHQIRGDQDLQTHVDYIHHNPVKHGYVAKAVDWPYKSLHRYIRMGWLAADWGTGQEPGEGFGE